MSLLTTRGILLRSHPYSESSRILRFLTPDHGIVSLMGKGVRSRSSRGEGSLETFGEGAITFFHRPDRDLHTLRDFRGEGSLSLGRELHRFVGASLLAELLLGHTLEQGDPELYEWVRSVLQRLGSAPSEEVPAWIFSGAWRTLAHLGFLPELDRCARCGRECGGERGGDPNRFDAAAGGLRCPACAPERTMPRVGPSARLHLIGLLRGAPPIPLPGLRGHLRLLESFCLHHLAPRRRFQSFAMLRPLLADEPKMHLDEGSKREGPPGGAGTTASTLA